MRSNRPKTTCTTWRTRWNITVEPATATVWQTTPGTGRLRTRTTNVETALILELHSRAEAALRGKRKKQRPSLIQSFPRRLDAQLFEAIMSCVLVSKSLAPLSWNRWLSANAISHPSSVCRWRFQKRISPAVHVPVFANAQELGCSRPKAFEDRDSPRPVTPDWVFSSDSHFGPHAVLSRARSARRAGGLRQLCDHRP